MAGSLGRRVGRGVGGTASLCAIRSADQSAPSWQKSYLELSPVDQARFLALRSNGLAEIEVIRGAAKQWPSVEVVSKVSPFDDPELTWVQRQHGVYVNYVGLPSAPNATAVRWLVVFIEPDPKANEPPAPIDDEHHTLSDGMGLHVTVWSQPNEGAVPTEVLAFPVSDGWVQRSR